MSTKTEIKKHPFTLRWVTSFSTRLEAEKYIVGRQHLVVRTKKGKGNLKNKYARHHVYLRFSSIN